MRENDGFTGKESSLIMASYCFIGLLTMIALAGLWQIAEWIVGLVQWVLA